MFNLTLNRSFWRCFPPASLMARIEEADSLWKEVALQWDYGTVDQWWCDWERVSEVYVCVCVYAACCRRCTTILTARHKCLKSLPPTTTLTPCSRCRCREYISAFMPTERHVWSSRCWCYCIVIIVITWSLIYWRCSRLSATSVVI